jgi:hypothetical protein
MNGESRFGMALRRSASFLHGLVRRGEEPTHKPEEVGSVPPEISPLSGPTAVPEAWPTDANTTTEEVEHHDAGSSDPATPSPLRSSEQPSNRSGPAEPDDLSQPTAISEDQYEDRAPGQVVAQQAGALNSMGGTPALVDQGQDQHPRQEGDTPPTNTESPPGLRRSSRAARTATAASRANSTASRPGRQRSATPKVSVEDADDTSRETPLASKGGGKRERQSMPRKPARANLPPPDASLTGQYSPNEIGESTESSEELLERMKSLRQSLECVSKSFTETVESHADSAVELRLRDAGPGRPPQIGISVSGQELFGALNQQIESLYALSLLSEMCASPPAEGWLPGIMTEICHHCKRLVVWVGNVERDQPGVSAVGISTARGCSQCRAQDIPALFVWAAGGVTVLDTQPLPDDRLGGIFLQACPHCERVSVWPANVPPNHPHLPEVGSEEVVRPCAQCGADDALGRFAWAVGGIKVQEFDQPDETKPHESEFMFELEHLRPVLDLVSTLVDKGFGREEVKQVAEVAESLEETAEHTWEFPIVFDNLDTVLTVTVWMELPKNPQVRFLTHHRLGEMIDDHAGNYMNEFVW